MIKITPLDGWGANAFPRPEVVKVASAGLRGNDLAAFLKRASHPLAGWVRANPPKPGEVYVHLVAMGSTEKFGCFFAGAPVQTAAGLKAIEQVAAGDLVLTHKNRYRRVVETFSATYSGRRVSITASGVPEKIVCTAEHPFWVVRRRNFRANARCEAYLKRAGKTKVGAVDAVITDRAEFVRADELVVGDYLIVPTAPQPPSPGQIRFDPYLLGVYLAEGCVGREYRDLPSKGKLRRIILTMSKDGDAPVVEELRALVPGALDVQPSLTSEKGIRVTIGCNDLAEECFRLFGGHATTKRIPADVFAQTREWKLRFLSGYLDGDGCVVKSGPSRCHGQVVASTASLNLALDLQRLFASVGIGAGATKGWNRRRNGCFGSKDHVIYQVSVGRGYSRELLAGCKRLAWDHGDTVTQKQAATQLGSSYALIPVTSTVVDAVENEPKFNFEVDEDNSYVVFAAVHNCNRNFDGYTDVMLTRDHPTFEKYARWYLNHQNQNQDKNYGLVPKAFYDPVIQRVELIAALNATKEAAARNRGLVADRTLNKMASGIDVAVSMSTKVPYDVCVGCGHKAKHRGEYCTADMCKYGGCREHLGRVFEDGTHLFVDNPHCTFFDISDVSDTRGADRTAFITGKVAGHYAPGGAELAEMLGLVAPEYLLDPRTLGQLRAARKLAAARPVGPAPDWQTAVAIRAKGAADGAYYARPADGDAAHRLLGALAADGVVLPPAEWLSLVTQVPAEKCAAVFVNGMDVARDLLARADLHDILAGPYGTFPSAPTGTYAWLAPTPKTLAKEAAAAVMGAAPRPTRETADPKVAAEIKGRYLAYQAGVLALHENSSNFPLLLADAARHTLTCSA